MATSVERVEVRLASLGLVERRVLISTARTARRAPAAMARRRIHLSTVEAKLVLEPLASLDPHVAALGELVSAVVHLGLRFAEHHQRPRLA